MPHAMVRTLRHLFIGGALPWPPLGLWPGVVGAESAMSSSLLVAVAGTCSRVLPPVNGHESARGAARSSRWC